MNCAHISATLTRDPEMKGESCVLKLSYNKVSGKKSYITAVANGALAKMLGALEKGRVVWIDGRLSGFSSDKWKTYIEIEHAFVMPIHKEAE